ncbi:MAG: LysM peptidoglycan-binding domain-containing protein [Rhizobiales bacterium]|nr:LysM peptidoglycan-binding domain-containing protein [Hyphomicrobiales bacterium]
MKNNPVAIFTGLAVAAVIGLGVIIYARQPVTVTEKPAEPAVSQPATPEQPADAAAEKKPEAAPPQAEEAAGTETPAPETTPPAEVASGQPEESAVTETPAPETAPAETAKAPDQPPQGEPQTDSAVGKPTFDTVRVESDGGTLVAGQATPGADVTLKRNGEVVGTAQANAEGDWVVVTDAPLPKGPSELSVEQKTAESGQTIMSDQSIAVVVPADPNEKAMVALVEPGMPTQVLQKPEPATTAEATPPGTDSATEAAATAGTEAKAGAETAEPPAAVTEPPAAATAGSDETPAVAEKQPEAEPETTTALAEPATEPAKTEEPAAQAPAAEQPAAEQPAVETLAAKPGAPVSLDAVDYNSSGDIVFSGSAAPGSAVRVYVDNAAVGDALADQSGNWVFAGTQKIAPGGHSLRVDQIDAKGKVVSRVELPFIREEASRVAEIMNAPEAQPEQQKTAAAEEPAPAAPEATVVAEAEAPKPTASETSEAAASTDTQIAPKPETAAPAIEADTEAAEPQQGETIAKSDAPAVTAAEEPAAGTGQPATAAEQPAAKTEEPAVAAQDEPAAQAEATEQSAAVEPQIEQKSADAAGATVATGGQAQPSQPKNGRIIIQPGNNLWKLSRVIYGKGISYTVIYEANKGQIRDPDLIYPGQIFATPNAVPPETIDPKRKKPLSAEEGGTTVQ